MFCENCGKPLQKGQNFCPDCGTPVEESVNASMKDVPAQTVSTQADSQQTAPQQTDPVQTVSQKTAPAAAGQTPDLKAAGTEAAASLKTLFGSLGTVILSSGPVQKLKTLPGKQKRIIGGAAGALVLVLVCAALFGGRGYKKTVDVFIKSGFETSDAMAIMSLLPFKEAGFDEEDLEDVIEPLEDACDDLQRQLKDVFGRDWELTYTITDDKPQDEDELESIQDDYEDDYGIEVKDARVVRVKLRFKGSKDSETTILPLPLVKIGRSWYIDYVTMGGIRIAPSF